MEDRFYRRLGRREQRNGWIARRVCLLWYVPRQKSRSSDQNIVVPRH